MIDTATQALSLALFDDGVLLARHHELAGRGHAERLLPAIAALPDGGRADRIAVDVGPGSFTGVRIGLAAARALAFAWSAPLHGFSTTALVAAGVQSSHRQGGPIAIAITGGHGELFWQTFDPASLAALEPLSSISIATLAGEVLTEYIYGSGADVLVAARGHGVAVPAYPDSAHHPLLPTAAATLAPRPIYGRGADAKPMAAIPTAA